ncbi:hypothetical protein J4230_05095 [Candidatus Woesearchaeota archaeon]|nr:hypothetical protein [Candidatus Woesearchaeota archaeon]
MVKMHTDNEYGQRYKEMVLGKTLRKVTKLRKDFKTLLLLQSDHELLMMLCHCARHHYGFKKKPLTEEEQILYEYMITYNYNPNTVYKWFLKTQKTEDVMLYPKDMNRLREGKLEKMLNVRKKEKHLVQSLKFMELARKTAWEFLQNDN